MRVVVMVVSMLLAAAGSQVSLAKIGSRADASQTDPVESTRNVIRQAYDLLQKKDTAGAAADFANAIQSSGFARLPKDDQYAVLKLAGGIALDQGENQRRAAYDLLKRASEFDKAEDIVWHARLSAAYALHDDPDSAHCISTIAQRWPQTLDQINDGAIYTVVQRLREDPAHTGHRFDVLDHLFDAKWITEGAQPSWLWLDLTRLLIKRGDIRKAVTVAARIDSAYAVAALRSDKRFDRVTRGDKQAFDVDHIAAAQLAAADARQRAAPDLLRPRILYQNLLLDTLRFEQALAISDQVIARIGDLDGAKVYNDFKDQYIWILDNRARALRYLGRWEDAVDQQRRAARRPEHGDVNVSQALNLGMLYATLDRSADALDAVSDLGDMSPYGRMQLEMVRLAVAVQRKDAAMVELHLTFMHDHRGDAISTYQSALLDAGRLDAAAAFLIERLRSENWRSDALADVQTYADVQETARLKERNERWRSVIARSDVQAEVVKVGRIERVNLVSARD